MQEETAVELPEPTFLFGSRLFGSDARTPREQRFRIQSLLTLSIVASNVAGALAVAAIVLWVIPLRHPIKMPVVVATPIYIVAALAVGIVWGTGSVMSKVQWVLEERVPDDAEQRAALRAPLQLIKVQGALWGVAVVLFSTMQGILDPELFIRTVVSVSLAGLVTCASTYLSSEFLLRPVSGAALTARPMDQLVVPGVQARTVLAWAIGSAVPVVGLITISIFALAQRNISAFRLAVAVIVLGAVTLVVGLALELLAIRATVDPIRGLRDAVRRVEVGALDTDVEVYDSTEMGLLQVGFNRMVAGLRERERIRDLFGRHVGEDVATASLSGDAELGGEIRDVAVVFVDMVGSTGLAARLSPGEVVTLLNRFFAVVVEVVADHAGLVNKFEGDAALALFGAHGTIEDRSGQALACARTLAARLARDVPECRAGIGVATGPVVAGNIGAMDRYEFTVIGTAVNEAARLTELAKTRPGGVLASSVVVKDATAAERDRWELGESVTLRGMTGETRLASPVDSGSPVVSER